MEPTELDKILAQTQERIERMKSLTAQTQGLLKRNDSMTEESDKHQAYRDEHRADAGSVQR